MGWHLKNRHSVKWGIRHPQLESFKLQTKKLLFPSYANIVCWREHYPTTLFAFVFSWLARCVFLVVLGLFYFLRHLNRAVSHSMWRHFLDISIVLSSFGVLWRPRSCRGICQLGYIFPASWEPPIWKIWTAFSIIYKLCLWKATLSDNLIYVFLSFWLAGWRGPKLNFRY